VSFVGDKTNLPAFYAYDSNYLYSRYRMDADPRQGATTRKQYALRAEPPRGKMPIK
jgi:hypothetical protein